MVQEKRNCPDGIGVQKFGNELFGVMNAKWGNPKNLLIFGYFVLNMRSGNHTQLIDGRLRVNGPEVEVDI